MEHSHDDLHEHSYNYNHAGATGASPKDMALLEYMLEHNKQHARELAETGSRLAGTGLSGAAELISDAVHYFDHANEKLEHAIMLINGEG